MTAAALQRRDEFGDVFAPPHRERCELQPSDPAFGTLLERHQRVLREIQAHRTPQERCRLLGREPEVVGAQLGHLASRAQAGKRQGRIDATRDDEVHLRWQVIEQEGDHVVYRLVRYDVVVIEDEGKILRYGCDLVDQGRKHRFDRRRLG